MIGHVNLNVPFTVEDHLTLYALVCFLLIMKREIMKLKYDLFILYNQYLFTSTSIRYGVTLG